jgi:hypothetical protein
LSQTKLSKFRPAREFKAKFKFNGHKKYNKQKTAFKLKKAEYGG